MVCRWTSDYAGSEPLFCADGTEININFDACVFSYTDGSPVLLPACPTILAAYIDWISRVIDQCISGVVVPGILEAHTELTACEHLDD